VKKAYLTFLVLKRLPWPILPFVIAVFIVVKALDIAMWTDDVAILLANIIGTGSAMYNVAVSVILNGIITTFSCSFLNNQPMTILYTSIVQNHAFNGTVSLVAQKGATLALVMGSNLGANITLFGALAGIMWITVVKSKGLSVSYFQFAKIGIMVTPFVLAVGCLVLIIELMTFDT